MLSLDFLDDVRRMNKRQVRLAARFFPWAPLVPSTLPLRVLRASGPLSP